MNQRAPARESNCLDMDTTTCIGETMIEHEVLPSARPALLTLDKPNAMMLDIETLSLGPTAYVTQIGVCVAALAERRYLIEPRNYWTTDEQSGRIDFETVQWWMAQDRKVAEGVFRKDVIRFSPDRIFEVLKELVDIYDCSVWASPAMFDLPILTSFFGGRKPWKYNVERDLMTLYKMFDPDKILQPAANSSEHDAAADAKWQMDYLMNIYSNLAA